MTDEMLALAQRNAAEAGATNVEFLKGTIEAIPLPADSVDVVISNCVINLAADKPAVFREIARVLRPGGRMGITDIVAEDRLTPEERAERGSYTGCIAGALSFAEFRAGLEAVGLADVGADPDPRRRRRHGQRDREGDEARGRPPLDRPDRTRGAADRRRRVLWRGWVLLMHIERAVPDRRAGGRGAALGRRAATGRGRRRARVRCRRRGTATALVAAAALERYGDAALLGPSSSHPNGGARASGRGIVAAAESLALAEGVRDLYLLTETAVDGSRASATSPSTARWPRRPSASPSSSRPSAATPASRCGAGSSESPLLTPGRNTPEGYALRTAARVSRTPTRRIQESPQWHIAPSPRTRIPSAA